MADTLNQVFDGINVAAFSIAALFYRQKTTSYEKLLILDRINENSAQRQKAILLNTLSTVISLISAWSSMISLSNLMSFSSVNVIRYIDWIVTCPMLQIQLAVLADAPASRYLMMVFNVVISNSFGLLGAFVSMGTWKVVFFLISCFHFVLMTKDLDRIVRDFTDNCESLSKGTSSLRKLCIITVGTWIPFPIVWVLSSDGFNWADWGTISEIIYNIIGLAAKTSVDMAIALMDLESKVEEESVIIRSRRSSFSQLSMTSPATPTPEPVVQEFPNPHNVTSSSFARAALDSFPQSANPFPQSANPFPQSANPFPQSPNSFSRIVEQSPQEDIAVPMPSTPRRRMSSPTPTFQTRASSSPYHTPVTLWNMTFHPVSTTKSALRSFLFS